jgi:hypothetical protein
MSTTIRVNEKTHTMLRELAQERGMPIQDITEKAVEMFRRHALLEATNAAYARLQANPEARKELEEELGAWDETLADGLELDE